MDVSAELDMDEARKRQLVDATINNEIEVVVNMIEADLALIDHRVNRRSTLLVSRQSGPRKLVRLSGVGLNAVHVVLRGASETGRPVRRLAAEHDLVDGSTWFSNNLRPRFIPSVVMRGHMNSG